MGLFGGRKDWLRINELDYSISQVELGLTGQVLGTSFAILQRSPSTISCTQDSGCSFIGTIKNPLSRLG